MAHAMRLSENLGKKIPFLARQIMPCDCSFLFNTTHQAVAKLDQFRSCSLDVAGPALRMMTKSAEELFRERRWVRCKTAIGIVRAPFGNLNPVDSRGRRRMRDIKDRN